MPDLSMTVKGQEFPAYDPRGIQGMGLAYATSNRGACHLRGYTVASEVLGIPVKTDPLVTEGKAELVKAFQDATAAVDSSGLCVFTTFAWSMENIAPQVDAACEGDWSVDKMLEVGERICVLGRNGEGKTTLLRLLTGWLRPERGHIHVLGMDPARKGPEIRRVVGYVPDRLEVPRWMRVADWYPASDFVASVLHGAPADIVAAVDARLRAA